MQGGQQQQLAVRRGSKGSGDAKFKEGGGGDGREDDSGGGEAGRLAEKAIVQ